MQPNLHANWHFKLSSLLATIQPRDQPYSDIGHFALFECRACPIGTASINREVSNVKYDWNADLASAGEG